MGGNIIDLSLRNHLGKNEGNAFTKKWNEEAGTKRLKT